MLNVEEFLIQYKQLLSIKLPTDINQRIEALNIRLSKIQELQQQFSNYQKFVRNQNNH